MNMVPESVLFFYPGTAGSFPGALLPKRAQPFFKKMIVAGVIKFI
jgi:hypothetical protein